MTDLTSTLADLWDVRLAAVALCGALAGLVRGFSGFGSALIYVPLTSTVYDPVTAAVTLFLIDFASATPLTIRALPRADWRDMVPLLAATTATVPIGVAALAFLDAITMRWIIAAIVFGALIALASGWRYHGRPRLPITLGVGALAGLFSGAAQMSGPPVIVYWLGGAIEAAKVRANLIVFLGLTSVVSGLTYVANGLFTMRAVAVALVAGPAFALAMIAGTRLFDRASEQTFRRVAYAIIALSGIISLPVLDRFYR